MAPARRACRPGGCPPATAALLQQAIEAIRSDSRYRRAGANRSGACNRAARSSGRAGRRLRGRPAQRRSAGPGRSKAHRVRMEPRFARASEECRAFIRQCAPESAWQNARSEPAEPRASQSKSIPSISEVVARIERMRSSREIRLKPRAHPRSQRPGAAPVPMGMQRSRRDRLGRRRSARSARRPFDRPAPYPEVSTEAVERAFRSRARFTTAFSSYRDARRSAGRGRSAGSRRSSPQAAAFPAIAESPSGRTETNGQPEAACPPVRLRFASWRTKSVRRSMRSSALPK
jgi:hypothetical protein